MKIIGLTGGIGSGKSTVAKEFVELNVPCYIADDRSKKLLSNDSEVIKSVKELLGEEAYFIKDDVEMANRVYIASQVFNDKLLLDGLNAILHPAVRVDFKKYCLDHFNAPYVIYEAAILFESGGHLNCDEVILVTVPLEERIKRVMLRDGTKREDVLARMNHQWNERSRLQLSNLVLINDNINDIVKKVKYFHEFIIKIN